MKYIKLIRGQLSMVDDDMFDLLSKFNWYLKSSDGNFYAKMAIFDSEKKKNKFTYMHSLVVDAPKGFVIDHKDGNGLNNQRDNLRVCTQSQNNFNKPATKRSKTGFKGVTILPNGRFLAQITINKVHYYLGCFASAELASEAYFKKAKEAHGEFLNLNPHQNKAVLIDSLLQKYDDQKLFISSCNTSGFIGVSFFRKTNKFRAYLTLNGKFKFIGYFSDAKTAALAYNKAASEHFGEKAKLNIIPE
jgi:hypothetical protein